MEPIKEIGCSFAMKYEVQVQSLKEMIEGLNKVCKIRGYILEAKGIY